MNVYEYIHIYVYLCIYIYGTIMFFKHMVLECHTFIQNHIIPFPRRERLFGTAGSGEVFIAVMRRGSFNCVRFEHLHKQSWTANIDIDAIDVVVEIPLHRCTWVDNNYMFRIYSQLTSLVASWKHSETTSVWVISMAMDHGPFDDTGWFLKGSWWIYGSGLSV